MIENEIESKVLLMLDILPSLQYTV